MKIMIASDIHGSAWYCRELVNAWEREKADKLLLLGDILYHGPRNDLPREYAPKEVIAMLNPLAPYILAVRGNCEAEVDQMVLDFSVMADYIALFADGITMYATHGHLDPVKGIPGLQKGDVVLQGHTHVPKMEEKNGCFFMNPGSVSIPKEKSEHGYMIFEHGKFYWKNLEGTIYQP
ncbi:MAG: phosphodiesterase [Lachnospiraceae bacterium]|nr:phosphodiesterase [Lachnospiraceae bacterium]